MTLYHVALTAHLFCVLAATAASGMTLQSALRLRRAQDLHEAQSALTEIRRTARVFPFATLGLLGTGAYMIQSAWTWSTPWIVASIAGLALMVILGSQVEGRLMRFLGAEIGRNGLSPAAQHLARVPVVWTAKCATLTLLAAVVLEMSLKPGTIPAVGFLVLALVVALPLGRRFAGTKVSPGRSGPEQATSSGAGI